MFGDGMKGGSGRKLAHPSEQVIKHMAGDLPQDSSPGRELQHISAPGQGDAECNVWLLAPHVKVLTDTPRVKTPCLQPAAARPVVAEAAETEARGKMATARYGLQARGGSRRGDAEQHQGCHQLLAWTGTGQAPAVREHCMGRRRQAPARPCCQGRDCRRTPVN